MKAILRFTSLTLFSLVALFLIWFGWVYASATDMLWFHAAAVPEEARAAVLPLYLALMNLIGGSSSALGALGLYVVLMPMRRGRTPGMPTALSAAFAVTFVMAAVTAEELAAVTGAPTSWHIMGVLLAIIGVAYLTHALSFRVRSTPQSGTAADIGSPPRRA